MFILLADKQGSCRNPYIASEMDAAVRHADRRTPCMTSATYLSFDLRVLVNERL
jgi:hypothetical protein